MTDQHNAPWDAIERYAKSDLNDEYAICLLQLRDRVAALEDNVNPSSNCPQIRSSADRSLVKRVAAAIRPSSCADGGLYSEEARRAINAMVDWLREQGLRQSPTLLETATTDTLK